MDTMMQQAMMEAIARHRKASLDEHMPMHDLMAKNSADNGQHGGFQSSHQQMPSDGDNYAPENEHDGEVAPQGSISEHLSQMTHGSGSLRKAHEMLKQKK